MGVSEEAARRAKDEERVLAIPTGVFRELGVFQGFSAAMDEWKALATSERLVFLRRGDAEQDPEYKQLIPYVLFTHASPEGDRSVFAYLRGPGQGEKRLVSKWSVGVGGHINDADAAEGDLFGDASRDRGRGDFRRADPLLPTGRSRQRRPFRGWSRSSWRRLRRGA